MYYHEGYCVPALEGLAVGAGDLVVFVHMGWKLNVSMPASKSRVKGL